MNYVIKIFNYRFYLKEFLLLFFTYFLVEDIFSWILVRDSVITIGYEKALSIGVFLFMIASYKKLQSDEKIYVTLFSLLITKLVIESLFEYESLFKQFTLFTVIYPVIFVVFIKYLLRSLDIDLLEFVVKFYLFTYIIFMILFGRDFSFGLESIEMEDYGPFSGDSRIIHARSVFMMIIPCLWYLDKFVKQLKLKHFIVFVFCTAVILIHQHRSVWSSAIFATLFYFFLNIKASRKTLPGIYRFLLIIISFGLITYFVLSSFYPETISFFSDRFSEILDPAKEGSTGNFRLDQTTIYMDYISEKPVLGWSFEGFELSNPLVDWWDENTGHHFHQGFIEILFYHGLAGLLLKYSFILIILIKAFTKKLSQESLVLVPFCLSGLVFSLSYVPPLIFWGHVGMCLYYLETKRDEDDLYSNTGI